MVGIGKDDRRVELFPKIALSQALYCRLRADRHENRRRDIAVRSMENTGASPRLRALSK